MSRLDLFRSWPEGFQALQALDKTVRESGLDTALLRLVKVRASQMNHCAFCLDMHVTEAIDRGEDPSRLIQLSAWRESPVYSDRERAALALTESVTRCERGVDDDEIEHARAHLTHREITQLVYAIATINAWNRLAITDQTQPLDAQPAARLDGS